jgi:hypothetical protein
VAPLVPLPPGSAPVPYSWFQLLPKLNKPISEVDVTQFLIKPIVEDIATITVKIEKKPGETGEGFILFRPLACYRKYKH